MSKTDHKRCEAKREILDRIQSKKVDIPPLPDVDMGQVIHFDDPYAKFAEMLAMVGGEAHFVSSADEISQILQGIEVFRDAQRIASTVPELVPGTMDPRDVADPHDLASLDWTVVRAEFMIAENGSVWVDGATLPHRVLLFIAQYLAIVVKRSEIVSNMHQAYERIEGFQSRFGVFVSGPSKTADIEQSLVLGAHGCRKLQVFVIDE